MAYDFHWYDDEHTIVRFHIHGDVAWSQYHQAVDRIIKELKSTTHRIDAIFDGTDGDMPSGSPLPHIKSSAQRLIAYPNMGVIVVVGTNKWLKFLEPIVSMVYKIYGIDMRITGGFTTSVADAVELIAKKRGKAATV